MSILLHSEEDGYEGKEQVFLRTCCGIVLRQRGTDDLHVVFGHLTEDDGNWFLSHGGGSSYWIDEQIEVLMAALAWMQAHCERDGVYGYRFKVD